MVYADLCRLIPFVLRAQWIRSQTMGNLKVRVLSMWSRHFFPQGQPGCGDSFPIVRGLCQSVPYLFLPIWCLSTYFWLALRVNWSIYRCCFSAYGGRRRVRNLTVCHVARVCFYNITILNIVFFGFVVLLFPLFQSCSLPLISVFYNDLIRLFSLHILWFI